MEEKTSKNVGLSIKNKDEVLKEVPITEATLNTGSYNTCCIHRGKTLWHQCGSSLDLDGNRQNVRTVEKGQTNPFDPTKIEIPKPNSCTECEMISTEIRVAKPVVRPQTLCCAHVHIACAGCHVLVQPRCTCTVHSACQLKVDACEENVRPMVCQNCEKGAEACPTYPRCERYKYTAGNISCGHLQQTGEVSGNSGIKSLYCMS